MEPELDDCEPGGAGGPDRPELDRLMQAAKDGQVEWVLVYHESHLSTDPSEVREILREWNDFGIEFRIVDPDEPESEEEG